VDQQVVDVSDLCIEIPQFGTKHSLNIAVAAGIVIWEVFQGLRGEMKKPPGVTGRFSALGFLCSLQILLTEQWL
jgi:tRNA C32,U32 (ribose-2'-O)-methylase TrmJ